MKYLKRFNESNSESGVKDITDQVDVKLLTTLDDERESVRVGDVVIVTYFMGGFKTYEFEVKFIEPRSPYRLQDLESMGNSDEYSDYDLENAYHVVTKDTYLDFLHPMNESVDNSQQGRTCGEYCRAEDIINHIIRGE